jgi:hypothetical protein
MDLPLEPTKWWGATRLSQPLHLAISKSYPSIPLVYIRESSIIICTRNRKITKRDHPISSGNVYLRIWCMCIVRLGSLGWEVGWMVREKGGVGGVLDPCSVIWLACSWGGQRRRRHEGFDSILFVSMCDRRWEDRWIFNAVFLHTCGCSWIILRP